MAMPAGASGVEYSVNQYGTGVEIAQTVKFILDGSSSTSVDAAAQAAMEAFITKLRSLSSVPVYASRKYTCQANGDAWPPA